MKVRNTIGLAGGALLACGIVLVYWLAFAPNTPVYEGKRTIKIPPGTSFEHVVDSLETAGVLRSAFPMNVFAVLTGWYQQVKPGLYRFSAGASNLHILGRLRRGEQDPVRVTIPPGTRPSVVAAILERDLYMDSTAFREALRDSALAADLNTDLRHLFGYMLPNTYQFYWITSAEQVIRRLKRTFEKEFTEEMAQKADSLGLTKEEVVELASIVQWETHLPDEKPMIAGVYLNRLQIGMPLQADATIQYVIMQKNGGDKRRLYYSDYDIPHPYNTYLHAGLPPGPITNPQMSTIRAVVNATDHNYRFFVADGSGGHFFSRTYQQHLQAVDRYHQLLRERNSQQEQE